MALTKTPIELSSTPSIVDGGNATAITIDSSENVTFAGTATMDGLTVNSGTTNTVATFESTDSTVVIPLIDSVGSTQIRSIDGAFSIRTGGDGGSNANTTERMRILADGSVAIGTAALPSGLGGVAPQMVLKQGGTNSSGIMVETSATDSLIRMYHSGSAGILSASYGSTGSYTPLQFQTGGATRFTLNTSGHPFFPSIRNSAGSYAAKITAGSAELTFDTSSARYKDNIRDSTYGLSAAMQLQSRMFEYKEDDQRTDIGFIAEEVNEVIPELVVIDSEGRPDAVNYDRISSVLLKAIQEQQTLITALTDRITALEG